MENKFFEQPYINIKNSPKGVVVIGFGRLSNPTFHYTLLRKWVIK